MKNLILGLSLGRNVDADRRDCIPAVLSRHFPAQVVHPDVRPVLFLHPVFDYVFSLFLDLRNHRRVHHFPVVRVHAVGDGPADICDEIRLGLIPKITQHLPVDKIKREPFLYVPAHHAAGKGIV